MNNLERNIRNHPFLAGVRENHLNAICAHAVEADFKAGDIMMREREPAFSTYLIVSGEVALEVHSRATHRDVLIDTVVAGEVLGWSWLFPPFCWHFQARAKQPTHAIMLDAAALMVRCEEDHQLGYILMKRITQVLIRRVDAMRHFILEHDIPLPVVPPADRPSAVAPHEPETGVVAKT